MNWLKRLIGMQDKTALDMERIERATARIADVMEATADEVERRFGFVAEPAAGQVGDLSHEDKPRRGRKLALNGS